MKPCSAARSSGCSGRDSTPPTASWAISSERDLVETVSRAWSVLASSPATGCSALPSLARANGDLRLVSDLSALGQRETRRDSKSPRHQAGLLVDHELLSRLSRVL